ncbi:MAG: 3-oxoacyl-ACP reductase FabG [Buchnera aphidicola (Eriosoma harunire)]
MKNKIALITGANRGIGAAIIKKLKKKVRIVIGTSRNIKGVNYINNILKNNGKGLLLDLENPVSIKNTINYVNKKIGFVDILINNAGINYNNLLIKTTTQEWEKIIQTNLTSIFQISKLVIKNMILKKSGKIITIGSMIGSIGNIGQISYATSKAGLIGFHKSLALEVAKYGITVNIIAPGLIKTDMINTIDTKQKNEYINKIPMRRLGTTNDIANAVIFLSSNQSSYITGHTLHINGGMYMH